MHSWSKNNLVLEAHSLWQTHANSCIFLLLSKVSSSKMEERPWTSKVTLNLKPVFKKLWSNMINMSQHFSIILKLFWDGVNQANCFISFRTRTRTCCTRISMYHLVNSYVRSHLPNTLLEGLFCRCRCKKWSTNWDHAEARCNPSGTTNYPNIPASRWKTPGGQWGAEMTYKNTSPTRALSATFTSTYIYIYICISMYFYIIIYI